MSAIPTTNIYPARLAKVKPIKKTLESENALPSLSPTAMDSEGRRFYLTGLPPKIKPEIISSHLAKYGDVAYVELDGLVDEEQAAFVTFKNSNDKLKELTENLNELQIEGQPVSVVKATPKKTQVFVGGLKPDVTAEALANYFSAFGHVHDTMVKYDPTTGISRCFGFVTYLDCDDIVHTLCKQRFFSMCGKRIEVKKAVPMSEQINMKKAQLKAAFMNEMNQRSSFAPPTFPSKRMPPRVERNAYTSLYENQHRSPFPVPRHIPTSRLASYHGLFPTPYPRYY